MIKIFKFFILSIIFIFWAISLVKADYLDSLSGTVYNNRFTVTPSTDLTVTFTGQYLYVKNITCSTSNNFGSGDLFKINIYLNGQIKNHLWFNEKGTHQLDINSFVFNSYRLTSSVDGVYTGSSPGCNVNGILFDNLPNDNNNKIIIDLLGFILFFLLFFNFFPFFWKLYKKFSLKK